MQKSSFGSLVVLSRGKRRLLVRFFGSCAQNIRMIQALKMLDGCWQI
jgi:hypothetical protein